MNLIDEMIDEYKWEKLESLNECPLDASARWKMWFVRVVLWGISSERDERMRNARVKER